jgi:hypothetical protein
MHSAWGEVRTIKINRPDRKAIKSRGGGTPTNLLLAALADWGSEPATVSLRFHFFSRHWLKVRPLPEGHVKSAGRG